jgi:hypothetical protein
MKLSDLKPLKAITNLKGLTSFEALIKLKESDIIIYTISSSGKEFTYDYFEISHYDADRQWHVG